MVKTDIKIIAFLLDKLAEEVCGELRLGECSRCEKPCSLSDKEFYITSQKRVGGIDLSLNFFELPFIMYLIGFVKVLKTLYN